MTLPCPIPVSQRIHELGRLSKFAPSTNSFNPRPPRKDGRSRVVSHKKWVHPRLCGEQGRHSSHQTGHRTDGDMGADTGLVNDNKSAINDVKIALFDIDHGDAILDGERL